MTVVSQGHTVSYGVVSDAALDCLGLNGSLIFQTNVSTRLTVATLMVMPGGALEVGRSSAPVASGVTAEIVIADKSINTSLDPEQFGTGLIGLGRVTMHGSIVSPTFVRTAAEPMAGDSALTLNSVPVGWRVGDRLVLPDTRQLNISERFAALQPQFEEFTITQISGTRVSLNRSLTYSHEGARNAEGVLEYLPHVGNVTRNVIVRSQAPAGTRGHTLYSAQADVDIRYVLFKDLGRTTNAVLDPVSNHIGRYPIHMHHLIGPVNPSNTGYQFALIGNAVTDGLKWPITVHDTHYGLIQDNVVFNGWGAGFVTEDGNESFNEFIHNFGLAIFGNENPRNNDGRDGSIFWLSGFNHVLRDNVAANAFNKTVQIVAGSGFNIWTTAQGWQSHIPKYRGADATVDGQYVVADSRYLPILEFARNEAYGAMPTGLTLWHAGSNGYTLDTPAQETVIRDFVGWHLFEEAYFGYPATHLTFDGFVVRGHPRATGIYDYGMGWYSGDYKTRDVTIRRADIQGMLIGINLSEATEGTVVVEDSYLRNVGDNIVIPNLATPGSRATPNPRTIVINKVRFEAMPGKELANTISMKWSLKYADAIWPNIRDETHVFNYQGVAGNGFRVYFAEQATQNIAGGLAPCQNTHANIIGLVCPATMLEPPTTRSTAPPAPPHNLRILP